MTYVTIRRDVLRARLRQLESVIAADNDDHDALADVRGWMESVLAPPSACKVCGGGGYVIADPPDGVGDCPACNTALAQPEAQPEARPSVPIVGTLMKHALSGDTVRARSYAQLLCDDMDKQVPGSAKYLRRVLTGDLGLTVRPASPPVQAEQPTTRDDGMPASADERALRRMLASRYYADGLYMDDGEASGILHGVPIDFMRDAVDDIDDKLRRVGQAKLAAEQAAQQGEPATGNLMRYDPADLIPGDPPAPFRCAVPGCTATSPHVHGTAAVWQGEPHVAAIDTSAERVEKSSGIGHVQGEPSDEWITDDDIIDLVRSVGLDWHAGFTLNDDEENRYAQLVRAVLALKPAVPEGWRLVPVEPTESMLNAAWSTALETERGLLLDSFDDAYKAAMAAAPQHGGSDE